jgi:hypothetical protein
MLINKKQYCVNDNEFTPYKHPNFSELNPINDLSTCEIIVGLLSDMAEMDDFIFNYNGTKYGDFIPRNVRNFKETAQDNITYNNNNNNNNTNTIILSPNKINGLKNEYYVPNINHYLYINSIIHDKFIDYFKYYIDTTTNNLNYNNLVCLVMIVKNAGDTIIQILTENLPVFDRYVILDTGSTDNTIENIRQVLKNKKGQIYSEPFINFRESRNRSLELAKHYCKYNLILDDTYIVRGDLRGFLESVRSDQFSDSLSIYIHSDDLVYCSNRITKSETDLRYIYKIHEVISNENNMNVMIPHEICYLDDIKNPHMEKRTRDRKLQDIIWLNEMVEEDPDNPRHLYYLAQTYKILENYEKTEEYLLKRINHKNKGFMSELIDSCFELARLYNFHLNKPWEECMKYYNMSYEMDKGRPDSLFFIGLHFYNMNDYIKAFDYFKQAFNIGFPIEKQYSLKPTISYIHLPKLLIPLCYNFKDFDLGIRACELYAKNNPPDKSIEDWYIIMQQMKILPKLQPPVIFDKKVICFIADGGYSEWNGNSIDMGIGGSEKYIIMMAKYMRKHFDGIILVFCNTSTMIECDGVKYIPLNNIYTSLTTHYIDICIISRYSQYIPLASNSYADKIYVVAHDLTLSGDIIIDSPKLKNIICLTEWHKNFFLNKHPEMKDKTIIIGNGIELFTVPITEKKTFKFIYSSAANRGLIILLQMWNDILNIHPTAELHCYCDLDNKYINITDKDMMDDIRKLCDNRIISMKNVYIHGWVDRETLEKAWNSSSIWLYPCIFKETFCITALEAAISKTLVITNNLAGLNDTVGNRGIIIHGDAHTETWKNQVLDVLKNLNNCECNNFLENNYNYAIDNTWEIQAKKMLNLFDIENNDSKNTFQWTAILMNK